MNRFTAAGPTPPDYALTPLQRQAMNALRRGDLDRAAELFRLAGDDAAAGRCLDSLARRLRLGLEVRT